MEPGPVDEGAVGLPEVVLFVDSLGVELGSVDGRAVGLPCEEVLSAESTPRVDGCHTVPDSLLHPLDDLTVLSTESTCTVCKNYMEEPWRRAVRFYTEREEEKGAESNEPVVQH